MQEKMGESDGLFDAWNNTKPFYLPEAAKAYGDIFVFTQFKKVTKRYSDNSSRRVLEMLLALWTLYRIEQDYAIYKEADFISKQQIDWVRDGIMRLCKTVKDEASGLIDVIAVTDDMLGSPIGCHDGDVYNRFIGHLYSVPSIFEWPSYWKEIRKIHSVRDRSPKKSR